MRKLGTNLRREVESYISAGYTRDAAITMIEKTSRRGIQAHLQAMRQQADKPNRVA